MSMLELRFSRVVARFGTCALFFFVLSGGVARIYPCWIEPGGGICLRLNFWCEGTALSLSYLVGRVR